MALTPDIAALIGFVCEGTLYGAYVVLFFTCLNYLVWNRRSPHMDKFLVYASCTLFVLCTANFGIIFNHFYTHLKTKGVTGISAENIPLAVGDFILSTADFVGDLILIHRCWIIWRRNYYVIIFPALAALGGFVCGIVTFHLVITVGLNHLQPPKSLVKLGTALFTLPLCTNVMITSLIVGRIFYMASSTRAQFPKEIRTTTSRQSNANRLIWRSASIMAESGALYLAAQLVFVVLFALENPAYKVMGYPIIQLYGIAATLIIYRVALGISDEQTQGYTGPSLPSFSVPRNNFSRGGTSGFGTDTTATYPTIPPNLDKAPGISQEFEMTYKIVPANKE